jgi:two-component system, cell cycle response regulator
MPHRRRDTPVPSSPAARPPPRPFLVVVTGPQFGDVFDLVTGRELVIGRGPGADLVVHDAAVAARHASVTLEDGGARLLDLDSESGTLVDGVRVREVKLRDGARFQLGPHLGFKLVTSDDVEAVYQRRLAQGALHEPLTGLYNRRHFSERLASELAAAQRHGRPLALLAIDVDGLRRIDEAHGPLAGDEALKMVAFVIQGAIRKEDVVARYGGDEFLVLARETALTGARALGERIRRAVERSRTAFGTAEIALTVSVGVVVSVGLSEFEPGRTEQQLLSAAERALRRAKETGPNAVVTAPAQGE